MAGHVATNLITNGLMLYFDAANSKSYVSGSTIWNDLSINGYNGTLVNGTSYNSSNGGSLVFDGVNNFVSILGTLILTQATFVSWIRRNGNQNSFDGILLSRGGVGGNVTGMNFNNSGTMLGYVWNDAFNTFTWDSNLVPPDLTWCMVAVSINSTSAVAYLCTSSGITSATNNVTHTSTTLANLHIASDPSGGRFFNGRISVAQIYNRSLSLTEIQQNYNTLKGRFGLI